MRRRPEIFGDPNNVGSDALERLKALDFEVRTPLNTISILTGYLLETCRSTERDYLKTIRGACQEILEALRIHAGDLESLPATTPLHTDEQHHKEKKKDSSITGKRILIVEDHQTNRLLLTQILKAAGAIVTAVESGEDAVDAVHSSDPFNLVLMDVHLPGISGFEATRRLRKDARSANIPIVAMTALSLKGDKERCLDAGMDAYIPKPINRSELFSVISELAS